MTRDDIIRMAQQAAAEHGHTIKDTNEIVETLTSFYRLAIAAEREACAKVIDAAKADEEDWDSNDWNQAVEFCAARIRARGQA